MASGSETRAANGSIPAGPGSRIRYVFLDVGETLLRVTQPGPAYRAILARHGYDVPAEIRALGRDRICMFHIKDRGYLGEGKVNLPEILKAIDDIRFEGYANLETTSPSGDVEADTRRNFEHLRKLMNA